MRSNYTCEFAVPFPFEFVDALPAFCTLGTNDWNELEVLGQNGV